MAAEGHTRVALDRVMRQERGRLLAGLVSRFGAAAVDLAEDAVQDAFVEALETWAYRGLPGKPGAMLMQVASRRLIDRLRRQGREEGYDEASDRRQAKVDDRVLRADVVDPELRLVVLCCHPGLTEAERLTLTLKLVSGFTAREIASVFLATEATIGQRVARALRTLRDAARASLDGPVTVFELNARMPSVLKSIYLLFNIGFAPRTGARLWLEEVCTEALRLAELLAAGAATRSPQCLALAALLCLQGARLPGRIDRDGGLVLLKNQDRSVWNRALIDRGHVHLRAARATDAPSPYHIEAAIAAAHVAAPSWEQTDWRSIEALYAALECLTRSPVVAVNACVARAMAGDPQGALRRLDELCLDARLADRFPAQLARGEVLAVLGRTSEAEHAFAMALAAGYSDPVRQHVEGRRDGAAESGLS